MSALSISEVRIKNEEKGKKEKKKEEEEEAKYMVYYTFV